MSGKKVTAIVEEAITPIAESFGYEIVDVEYIKKFNGMNLTIFITKPDGITLNDCETFSRAIDEPLERLNPTNDEGYTLNISSPGMDRPLKSQKDFKRNLNKEIELNFYATINGKKQTSGLLKSFTETTIIIDENGDNIEYELNKISKIVPIIRF